MKKEELDTTDISHILGRTKLSSGWRMTHEQAKENLKTMKSFPDVSEMLFKAVEDEKENRRKHYEEKSRKEQTLPNKKRS
jgi:hypothetical protein